MADKMFVEEILSQPKVKVAIEAQKDGKRKTISIKGALAADVETANGRVYPAEVVKAEVERIKAAMEAGESFEAGLDGEVGPVAKHYLAD